MSTTISTTGQTASTRSLAPVFVLGCVRSGTTLLYHMLLSAGNFAVYRTESSVLNLLEPRFGDLSVDGNKRRLLNAWCDSRLFTASGLDKESVTKKVMDECRNGGDFLRIVMSEIARKQGVRRWADTTPEHLLYLHRIKETIPDALVIHIIRDGRDVALSTDKQGYIRRLPWDRTPSKMAAGLYWEWMVRKGRRDGRDLGQDYIEVHFEDLIREPRQTLARLGQFIEQDLDYDQILRVGIGSVSAPNTSFGSAANFNPVGRWHEGYSDQELRVFESLVGPTLEENGYQLATGNHALKRTDLQLMRATYLAYFNTKLYLKAKTPLGRLLVTRDLSWV
ncbi:MAG TPA: sulfotransferase [Candidatus Dormibacteraeota bacterium]|nr:sulfotransferase [Candidatus Dormibacteraeota bacterium]